MKAQIRRAVHAILASPLQAPALALIRALCRAAPSTSASRAIGYYAGEQLASQERILEGRVPTGSRIELLSRDEVHRHIYLYGIHEPATTRFLMSVVVGGWTVVDVGANAGYFSLLAADLVGPTGKVFAFEPNPELFGLLARSAALQTSTALVPVEAALGDRPGREDLYLSSTPGNTGLSTLRPEVAAEGAERVQVTTMRLDDFCEELSLAPQLIKVDVEGHELQVLAGARGLLEESVPRYVVCELETARCPADPLLEHMASLGYRACSLTEKGVLMPYEDRAVQNLVFVAGARP